MEARSLGVHLLLVPKDNTKHISQLSHNDINNSVEESAESHRCSVHGVSVQKDHIHVLVHVADEKAAAAFVASMLLSVTEAVSNRDPLFELSESLHVTLLPPWHLEILSSFLRDQERYHATHSVQDEINEIFRPDGVSQQMADA